MTTIKEQIMEMEKRMEELKGLQAIQLKKETEIQAQALESNLIATIKGSVGCCLIRPNRSSIAKVFDKNSCVNCDAQEFCEQLIGASSAPIRKKAISNSFERKALYRANHHYFDENFRSVKGAANPLRKFISVEYRGFNSPRFDLRQDVKALRSQLRAWSKSLPVTMEVTQQAALSKVVSI